MVAAKVLKPKLNVQFFPRPPLIEKAGRHVQIRWHGQLIADTKNAFWVLETHHPPTYYIPPSAVLVPLTRTPRTSSCEWKGAATYHSVKHPETDETVANRIWSYEQPSPGYLPIKGHLSFYAGPWDCFVDGEKVEPQPGDFYGGWVTEDMEGIVKGRNGNWDPVV